VDDEEGERINSVADVERVILSRTHYHEEIDDIDDNIGKPPSDKIEPGISPAQLLELLMVGILHACHHHSMDIN
jgi:hypothetical protein